ncbi:MAG: hypothetical protein HY359_08640 [Candidatus Rokubacteria bacterium]|nr:hypothetical protein [Candidatus Rokubacteria bacterium]
MPPPPERRWPGLVASYTIFLTLLALAATPAYLFLEPANRPAVVRLAVALVVGVVLIHLLRVARARLAAQPPSAFEAALVPTRPEARHAPLFVTLRQEVRFSVARRSYFEHVLWPRLGELAAARGIPIALPGARPLGRGPSLATLRDLVEKIEGRP